jgi:hypothetical protein
MSKEPNQLPNKISLGDYAMGVLISVVFSALICSVVLYGFHAWNPTVPGHVPHVTTAGLLVALAICFGLSIWPSYLIKPSTLLSRVSVVVVSIASLIFALSRPDWLHGCPYFFVLATSILIWLVKSWRWNPDFKSHKRPPGSA